MCQLIDITSKFVQEDKIRWTLTIGQGENPRIGIKRIYGEINIYINATDFDEIPKLKERALRELRKEIKKGMIEDLCI